MTETWIDDDSLFSTSLWNHFNNAESRVNNNNEGYNSRFNKKTGNVPHPNIWHFIEIIQKEEFLLVQMRYVSPIKKTLVSRGRGKVYIERDLKILQAKNKFLNSKREYDNLIDLILETQSTIPNFLE